MAKKSVIERNRKRQRMVAHYANKRTSLRAVAKNVSSSPEERYGALQKLAKLPRNSSPTRVRLRCEVTGRGRGNYRKFKLSRIAMRELASLGQIPGVVKSSW